MASRLAALLPRLLVLTVIWLLGTATYTVAAGGGGQELVQEAAQPAPKPPQVLEVPDVRRQAYVFAKGILQDGGFAWSVEGSVRGYAANTVVSQRPAPGTRVVDNGAPTVVVRLARNASYSERGLPENSSPYRGSPIVLASSLKKEAPEQPTTTTTETTTTTTTTTTTESPAPQPPAPQPQPQEETREPDFVVPGAPKEPTTEMPLPQRAKRLADRVAAAAKPTKQLVNFWLYQHSWIVYGARYGWADGDEALRVLIRVDESLQRRWDFGARSERVARRALAYVLSQQK
jgi:PASTA domain